MSNGPCCTFCDKKYGEFDYIIPAPNNKAAICDECVMLCGHFLVEAEKTKGMDKDE